MQIYIYSRKSVYTGKGESVENQVEMCRQYISHKIPHASKAQIYVYEDEGFSAKDTNRPRFQQMLRDMKTHKPDYVVCYRLDRISRNVSDFSSLIETFQRERERLRQDIERLTKEVERYKRPEKNTGSHDPARK